jgi:hypothetical protein
MFLSTIFFGACELRQLGRKLNARHHYDFHRFNGFSRVSEAEDENCSVFRVVGG